MNCDENGLKAGSDHQHTKYYLHRYDYCPMIAIFRAGLNFLKEYAAVAKMRPVVITTITLW